MMRCDLKHWRLTPRWLSIICGACLCFLSATNATVAQADAAIDPPRLRALLEQGARFSEVDQFNRAIEAFSLALKLAPWRAEIYRRRADGFRALRRPKRAITDYNRAIEITPDANAFFGRAMIHAQSHQFDAALRDFDAAIAVAPKFADAFFQRGRTHHHMGQNNRARADHATAIRLDPHHAWAYGFDYRHGLPYERRLSEHRAALKHAPDNAKAFFNRGMAFRYKRLHHRAILDFGEAIRQRPEYAQAYFQRGASRIAQNKSATKISKAARNETLDDAIADFSSAIELKPDFALAYFHRGRARIAAGRKGSKADFTTAKRLAPNNLQIEPIPSGDAGNH